MSGAASNGMFSAGDADPPDSLARDIELTEAVRWYESKRARLGGELLDQFSALITRLTLNPESGSPISADQKTRRLLVPRFPYQVVYRVCPDEIVVVALAHLKRRPGYWKHRH